MNGTIKVKGGNPLNGDITPIPNKNSILPALAASLLSNKTITYKNVPKSSDVEKMLKSLKSLGAEVDSSDYDNIKIKCENITTHKVDEELGMRASILFAGPLIARLGKAEIPLPGGCVLGKRSINAHLDVFEKIGIHTEFYDKDNGQGWVRFTAPNEYKESYYLWPDETSVTATENFVIFASGIKAKFRITNAASEPHVTDLLNLLKRMGANIEGIESNTLNIVGTKEFKSTEFAPGPDHIDIAGIIAATGITNGRVTIKNANIPRIVGGIVGIMEKFNIVVERVEKDLVVYRKDGVLKLDPINSGLTLAAEGLPKITPKPWPGYPVDAFPALVPLACKTEGKILLKNWMYESGLDFVSIINDMGGNIYKCDSERVIVFGPVKFNSEEVTAPFIIEATKAIVLAALADNVETTIHGSDVLKRRYPDFVETYKNLGANIEVIN